MPKSQISAQRNRIVPDRRVHAARVIPQSRPQAAFGRDGVPHRLALERMEPERAFCVELLLIHGGGDMLNKSGSNRSLWPQQAQPTGAIPKSIAIGLCTGIVAAISAYSVLSELQPSAPTSFAVLERETSARLVNMTAAPVIARAVETSAKAPLPAMTAAVPVEIARTAPVEIARVAPVDTPRAAAGADNVGRAASTDGRGGEAPADRSAAISVAPAKSLAADAPVVETAEAAKPAAEPPVKMSEATAKEPVRPARVTQKKREKPTSYSSHDRSGPIFPFFGLGSGSFFGRRG